jgi:prolyl-tRNA editing enzyme YbaK/EbsC (Cys-tRNA(Pro) deacylase)
VLGVTWDLTLTPALDRPELLADPVRDALAAAPELAALAQVAEIDPELADTAEFCARYGVALAESANCVLVSGKRAGETRMAAALVLADTRADVNGVLRRTMDVRKLSFASREVATGASGMEYGGITPVGLPHGWPVFLSAEVAAAARAVIGSGLRRSKLVVPGSALAGLPGAVVVDDLATPVRT